MLSLSLPQTHSLTHEYMLNGYTLVDSLLDSQEILHIKDVISELVQEAESTGQYDSLLEFEKERVEGRRISGLYLFSSLK